MPRYTTFADAVARFREVSEKYEDNGACDTEPRGVFADIIVALASDDPNAVPFVPGNAQEWQLYSGTKGSFFAAKEMTVAVNRVIKLATPQLAADMCNREGWFW